MRVLFLDQGRGRPNSAMGVVRARHGVRAGLKAMGDPIEFDEATVPPLTLTERRLARYVPGSDAGLYGSVRWHLLRSRLARDTIRACVHHRAHDVVHVTTDQVSLLLGDIQREVPIVLSLDVPTIDWARLRRRVPPDAPDPYDLRPLRRLERRALERAPLAIAWTETVAAATRRVAPGARVAVLHPGIDPTVHRVPQRGSSGPVRILFVGGRWEQKGGPDLLAALQPLLGASVRLDVVTTDAVVPPRGVEVHRARVGSERLAALFDSADVLCLPTHVDAVPFVLLEAMASGLPVVSTRVGSIHEIVGDAGLVVDPGDRPALAAALEKLVGDPSLRASMGAEGRLRVERHYNALANAPTLVERLREVVADGRRR